MGTVVAEIGSDDDAEKGRTTLVEFLINSSQQLRVPPIVKYTALSLFADRFLRALRSRKTRSLHNSKAGRWLLHPLTESNLQLFALASIWVSSKLHDVSPLSVKNLKGLGDKLITEQCFTTRDFAEAVLGFEIGASNVAFIFLEELFIKFRELSKIGDALSFNICMNIMDLLYEAEETSFSNHFPCFLAASIFAASYVLTIPTHMSEFPLLPWLKVATSYEEEDLGEAVERILKHVLNLGTCEQQLQWSSS